MTLFFLLRGEIPPAIGLLYGLVQIASAVAGVYLAHAMFALPIAEVSHKLREGPAQCLSEFVATFGLMATIAGAIRYAAPVRGLAGADSISLPPTGSPPRHPSPIPPLPLPAQ